MEWIVWALILFVPASLADLWLFLQISGEPSIWLVFLTQLPLCFYGWWRLRSLDISTIFYVAAETQKGIPIVKELWGEVLLILGAIFLLVPGFINSALALILIYPKSRLLLLEIFDQTS